MEAMKAVRLVGKLPNVVYVVAMDKWSVERALGRGVDGRRYIEKIVDTEIRVPNMQEGEVLEEVGMKLKGIEAEMVRRGTPRAREDEWSRLGYTVLNGIIQTPRDMKRYINNVEMAVEVVPTGEVLGTDLMALEGMRLKAPGIIEGIEKYKDTITTDSATEAEQWEKAGGEEQGRYEREALEAIAKGVGEGWEQDAKAFIKAYFPRVRLKTETRASRPGEGWERQLEGARKERRIEVKSVLETVLSYHRTPEADGRKESRELGEVISEGNKEEIKKRMAEIDIGRREDAVLGLGESIWLFSEEASWTSIPVLMEQRKIVPVREERALEARTKRKFELIIGELLGRIERDERNKGMKDLLDKIEGIGSKARMLDILAWKEETDGWGIDKERYEGLEAEWFTELGEATEDELERETDWFSIATRARRFSKRTGKEWTIPENKKITAQVVTGARTTALTAEQGEKRIIAGLEWKALIEIWGDENWLITEIEKAQERPGLSLKEAAALELGWEYWAGRSEDDFASKDLDEIWLHVEEDVLKKAERMIRHDEKVEEVLEKALRRGHGQDWKDVDLQEASKEGTKRMKVRTTEEQQQWATEKAETENVTTDTIWKRITQDGIEKLEKQRRELA